MTTEHDLRAAPAQGRMDVWRELQDLLAEWRAAERRMAAAQRGSVEHSRAAEDVARIRAEYQRVFALEHPKKT